MNITNKSKRDERGSTTRSDVAAAFKLFKSINQFKFASHTFKNITMKLTTIVALLPLASAFTTTNGPAARSTTALSSTSIDTRHRLASQELGVWAQHCVDDAGNYAPCDAVCGHDRRASWESYAPMTSDGNTVRTTGAIGCPGGGDWCYATSFGGAMKNAENVEMRKNAANVAAALAGLGSGVGGAKSDVGLSIPKGPSGSGQIAAVHYQGSIGFTTSGHDVRGARGSYAKPTNYHFVTGEIGLTQGGAAAAVGGARSAAGAPAYKKKSYGLGSWKK